MKSLLAIALITLTLVSCGKDKDSQPAPSEPTPVQNASILSVFRADTEGLHGVNELDFRNFELGVQQAVTFCDGSFGNSGQVNGVDKGFSLFEGTESEGTYQYGHLAYVGASNPLCRALSKERYTYKIVGKTLTLCMVNYPFCADYTEVE